MNYPSFQPSWSTETAKELYAIDYWGDGYFDINASGHVCVKPRSDNGVCLDLFDIAQALQQDGLSSPVLVRFTDILADRVRSLQHGFKQACAEHAYNGAYTPVYPIKVNQQHKVIEGISKADGIGLEAGSKAELLAILGLSKAHGLIICNGYKDRGYIRLALIGLKMGLDLYIVIEKPSELDILIDEARQLDIRPQLGVRIRLSSISAGKWQNSGGEKSKFGFHANEVLRLIERLRQENWLEVLQLMHFHMGSQIANIHDIKAALREAGQFYAQLRFLGAPIRVVDAGGGLGVDYDGSRSRGECSMNYNIDEYAQNIVRSFAEVCSRYALPHPDIVTESGRAITAHHAVLIADIIDVETVDASDVAQFDAETGQRHDIGRIDRNALESYHDAQFDLTQARSSFVQGDSSLAELANAERLYIAICQQVKKRLNPNNHAHREILKELEEKLADKLFCNFSLFQSLPDIWGIDQVFPVMPIHRLGEVPQRRAVLQDLTCDSDGRIDCYVDSQNLEKTLPVHDIKPGEPYFIGFFLVGAYQEILGDMHNLFGDTHSVNIELDGDGYRCGGALHGENVSDLLDYVHINPDELKTAYRQKLAAVELPAERRHAFEQELFAGLTAYTYLEK
ncbi:MAG: biosynthetic arginine decarboxylase [Gammaproteobacteria bacterium]